MACFLTHTWGDWKKVTGICEEKRVCRKCGKEKIRNVGHDYGEWTKIAGKCEEVRKCAWCKKEERRDAHSFGEKEYLSKNSCTIAQTCKRCGRKKFYFNCHQFTDWDYKNEHSCTKIRYCEHCGAKEYGRKEHCWRDSALVGGKPEPQKQNATYHDCLEDAIHYAEIRIKKLEDIMGKIQSSNDEDIIRKYIEQSDELRLKKLKYEGRLKSCNPEELGDICERCWSVINWGITKEELMGRIMDE